MKTTSIVIIINDLVINGIHYYNIPIKVETLYEEREITRPVSIYREFERVAEKSRVTIELMNKCEDKLK